MQVRIQELLYLNFAYEKWKVQFQITTFFFTYTEDSFTIEALMFGHAMPHNRFRKKLNVDPDSKHCPLY